MNVTPELVVGAIVVGQVLLATFVGRDASRRGRPALPWVLLTLVAPALGAGAYLLSGRRLRHD